MYKDTPTAIPQQNKQDDQIHAPREVGGCPIFTLYQVNPVKVQSFLPPGLAVDLKERPMWDRVMALSEVATFDSFSVV